MLAKLMVAASLAMEEELMPMEGGEGASPIDGLVLVEEQVLEL